MLMFSLYMPPFITFCISFSLSFQELGPAEASLSMVPASEAWRIDSDGLACAGFGKALRRYRLYVVSREASCNGAAASACPTEEEAGVAAGEEADGQTALFLFFV
ncbi:uncharacterized protein BKA78DRAFT_100530 [Phyllosticta capitalensis]|uniref:Secreted protein n=1 Tax=Phyllosticta capitalensis TaxID=121624 RepID=A0ABR1YT09_9PEZI